MKTIISGNFAQLPDAKQALADFSNAGFSLDQTTTFFVFPIEQGELQSHRSGDESGVDGPAQGAASGAAAGGAVGIAAGGAIGVAVGLAALPVLGPMAPVAAAGVGAYVGSLSGALANMEDKDGAAPRAAREPLADGERYRSPGTLVAVAVPDITQQDIAIAILRTHGATDIERTAGTIAGGIWTGFDALAPFRPLAD